MSRTLCTLILLCLVQLSLAVAPDAPSNFDEDNLTSSRRSNGSANDDEAHFSIGINYGEIDLPRTPVLINTVELTARYAARDFMGRTGVRRGIVLAQYPQIEIAVIPLESTTSVEVRLVIWALYALMVDMIFHNSFKLCEVAILWHRQPAGYLYFTKPGNTASNVSRTDDDAIRSRLGNATAAVTTAASGSSATTAQSLGAGAGHFGWRPIFKQNAHNLSPTDIFLLALGAMKVIAPFAAEGKVDGPFHVGSELVDVNMQVYLHNRRVPRTFPPFFQYAHVLEVVRRMPRWMLERRRFAEWFCSIEVTTRPVGVVLVEKGPFRPGAVEDGGDVEAA